MAKRKKAKLTWPPRKRRGEGKAEKLLREFGVHHAFDGWDLANWAQPDDELWSPECRRRAEFFDMIENLAFLLRCRGTTRAQAIRAMRNAVLMSTFAPHLPEDWQEVAGQAEMDAGDQPA